MNTQYLNQLQGYCTDIAGFLANTEDGNGTSLHDIKHTFDYVLRTVENLGIEDTRFGSDAREKIQTANAMLSVLWNCLNDLKKALEGFVETQKKNNNSNY